MGSYYQSCTGSSGCELKLTEEDCNAAHYPMICSWKGMTGCDNRPCGGALRISDYDYLGTDNKPTTLFDNVYIDQTCRGVILHNVKNAVLNNVRTSDVTDNAFYFTNQPAWNVGIPNNLVNTDKQCENIH